VKTRIFFVALFVLGVALAIRAWHKPAPKPTPPAPIAKHEAEPAPMAEPIHLSDVHAAPVTQPSAFEVDGQVLATDTNAGIVNASVVFAGAGAVSDTLTIAGGRFHWSTQTPGSYQLSSIVAKGYVSYAPELGHSPIVFSARAGVHMSGVTLFLTPGADADQGHGKRARGDGPLGTIAGKVVDEMGAPVQGAMVVASHGEVEERVQSEEDGAFTLADLPAGAYRVRASHPEWVAAEERGIAAGTNNLRLKLSAGGTVSGQVKESDSGKPIAAFLVAALVRKGAIERGETKSMSFFDQAGHYAITGLRAGMQCLTVIANGRGASDEQCVDVKVGSEAHADFSLSRGAQLRGRVLDRASRAPIVHARVALENALGVSDDLPLPVYASTETDSDGHFELDGLESGVRSIFVTADGHHSRVLPGLHLDPDHAPPDIDIDLIALQPGEAPSIESAGINASVRSQGDAVIIIGITPGGGADQAGLLVNDAIVRVDGIETSTLTMQSAIEHLRGPEGTTVTVSIRRPPSASTQDVVVTRKQVVNR
jgi:Carboxypeptidase regulatory-like domain/PDZ domain